MDYEKLNTVEKIAKFTRQQVDIYRKFQSKKRQVIDTLKPIFEVQASGWKIVIDMGEFRDGFVRIVSKKGMKALQKLLYEIDDMYKSIDFKI